MKTLLLAMLLMTAVHRSEGTGRITLVFDGPVASVHTLKTRPPGIIIDVPGAAATPGALQGAERAGLTIETIDEPRALRVTLPLQAGASASIRAAVTSIAIDVAAAPILLPASPARDPSAAPGGVPAPAGPPEAAGSDYVIGPEDLLQINVFELPELKTTTRVLGDGTISLPLLGVVRAAGLTKKGLEARLRGLLQERFLLDPQVTIAVTEFRSKQVSVIGAVNKPGTYQMIGPRTLLQMISEAGGLTKEAGSEIIILRRAAGGGSERIALDLDDLVIRGNPELNLPVEPSDVINVPVDRPIYVYVDGAVKNPGQVESRSSRPITLLQAVARAGGLTERANLRGVHILRKRADGTQVRIPVNLREIRKGKADDIVLEDGDVIVVPETFF